MNLPAPQEEEPRMTMKERQWQLRENTILDAAAELLRAKGFAAMTLEDITEAIGISRPTLYQHFKSKEDLVANIAARSMRQGCETLRAQDSAIPPIERLRSFIHWCVTVRFVVMGGAISEFASTALSQGQRFPAFDCARREFHAELIELVSAAQTAHQVRDDIVAELLVELLLGFLKNPSLDTMIQSNRTTPGAIEDAVWRLLARVS